MMVVTIVDFALIRNMTFIHLRVNTSIPVHGRCIFAVGDIESCGIAVIACKTMSRVYVLLHFIHYVFGYPLLCLGLGDIYQRR